MTEPQQLDLFTGGRAGEYRVPHDARIVTCQSCGARITWARTANDKPIPLSLATVEERDGVRYAVTHFADCPEGKEWSKR